MDNPTPEVVTRPRSEKSRRAAGLLGEVIITLGILALLLVVYDLWWTNVVAGQEAAQQRSALQQQWDRDLPPTRPGPPETVAVEAGQPFGLVYIPRLKDKVWGLPLVEGVTDADLAKGIGHVPATALPGEIGNFVIAGHRATNGEPLAYIDRVRPGDEVIVETATGWYTYTLQRDQIVLPDAAWVMDPVPGEPAATTPTEAYLTVITCNPRWASYERWIWWGTLTDRYRKQDGTPPVILAEGRS